LFIVIAVGSVKSSAQALDKLIVRLYTQIMLIDTATVRQIVIAACDTELLPRFNEVKRHYKADGSIVTEADIVMQAFLTRALSTAYPDIVLLGEEMTTMQQQALLESGQPLWCLDPIDGTSNFATGLPFFCVSLALIVDQTIIFGLVYDPIRRECFHAYSGHGAYLNDAAITPREIALPPDKAIAIVDFKRLSADLAIQLVAEKPYGSQRNLGSTALELCWLATGRVHLYLHGGQQLWDYAAAQLIVSESGLIIQTLDGKALYDGNLMPKSALSASHSDLFEYWSCYLNLDQYR
jgi:myo-inositol-1(or 4)-monophosphatase